MGEIARGHRKVPGNALRGLGGSEQPELMLVTAPQPLQPRDRLHHLESKWRVLTIQENPKGPSAVLAPN